GEKDTSLYRPALEELRRQIRSSTTSMTSVPKPLKFLRPHYGKLKEIYENMAPGENKRFAADIISVLAMTMSGERECLKYRLVGSQEELASWGHEYVREVLPLKLCSLNLLGLSVGIWQEKWLRSGRSWMTQRRSSGSLCSL
ncbi:PSMD2 isoform 9, partial [Pongo abelii]